MKVLVACEYSGVVREALRGFVSWSDEQEWRRSGKRLGVKVEQARALLAELDAGEGGEA